MRTDTRTTGVDLIAAERQRQIDAEDWTPAHDDEHTDGALAMAAAAYTLTDAMLEDEYVSRRGLWPWGPRYWKPTPENRVRELVKAGALIAAEIDRLQRAAVLDERSRTDGA